MRTLKTFSGLFGEESLNRPLIMGVVNVTPDSFSDGGHHARVEDAVAHGLKLKAEGADILDIGGESTRPGADPVSVDEELARVIPAIEGLVAAGAGPLSIDTRNAAVMQAAVQAGAGLINDVSALAHDPAALAVAAALNVPVVLMHAKGQPKNMQDDPHYDDVVSEVLDYLTARARAAEEAGIDRSQIVIDPGIGFGKTLAHNLALMQALGRFAQTPWPVLLGASRKRFIAALDEAGADVGNRLGGSLAAVAAGYQKGCRIFRVHDVMATKQLLLVLHAIR